MAWWRDNIKKTPQEDFFLQCFYTMVFSSIDSTLDESTLVQHTQDERLRRYNDCNSIRLVHSDSGNPRYNQGQV